VIKATLPTADENSETVIASDAEFWAETFAELNERFQQFIAETTAPRAPNLGQYAR